MRWNKSRCLLAVVATMTVLVLLQVLAFQNLDDLTLQVNRSTHTNDNGENKTLDEPLLLLCLYTGGKDYENKVQAQLETIADDDTVLFVTRKQIPTNRTLKLDVEAEEGGRPMLYLKTLRLMHRLSHDVSLSKYQFVMKADDDTYVNLPRIRELLRTLDPDVPMFLGSNRFSLQTGGKRKSGIQLASLVQKGEWFRDLNMYGMCHGGSGYILSRGLLNVMKDYFKTCERAPPLTHMEDAKLAFCIYKYAGVKCTGLQGDPWRFDYLKNSHAISNTPSKLMTKAHVEPTAFVSASTFHKLNPQGIREVHAIIKQLNLETRSQVISTSTKPNTTTVVDDNKFLSAWNCTVIQRGVVDRNAVCQATAIDTPDHLARSLEFNHKQSWMWLKQVSNLTTHSRSHTNTNTDINTDTDINTSPNTNANRNTNPNINFNINFDMNTNTDTNTTNTNLNINTNINTNNNKNTNTTTNTNIISRLLAVMVEKISVATFEDVGRMLEQTSLHDKGIQIIIVTLETTTQSWWSAHLATSTMAAVGVVGCNTHVCRNTHIPSPHDDHRPTWLRLLAVLGGFLLHHVTTFTESLHCLPSTLFHRNPFDVIAHRDGVAVFATRRSHGLLTSSQLSKPLVIKEFGLCSISEREGPAEYFGPGALTLEFMLGTSQAHAEAIVATLEYYERVLKDNLATSCTVEQAFSRVVWSQTIAQHVRVTIYPSWDSPVVVIEVDVDGHIDVNTYTNTTISIHTNMHTNINATSVPFVASVTPPTPRLVTSNTRTNTKRYQIL